MLLVLNRKGQMGRYRLKEVIGLSEHEGLVKQMLVGLQKQGCISASKLGCSILKRKSKSTQRDSGFFQPRR